jgi:hypothetical protein
VTLKGILESLLEVNRDLAVVFPAHPHELLVQLTAPEDHRHQTNRDALGTLDSLAVN